MRPLEKEEALRGSLCFIFYQVVCGDKKIRASWPPWRKGPDYVVEQRPGGDQRRLPEQGFVTPP